MKPATTLIRSLYITALFLGSVSVSSYSSNVTKKKVSPDSLPSITWLYPKGAWPSFSSDGSEFVFVLGTQKTNYFLATMKIGDTLADTLYRENGVSASRPDWSWNQNSIAFSYQKGQANSLIYTIHPDSLIPRPYTSVKTPNNISLLYPSWSRNKKFIIAVGYKSDTSSGKGPEPIIFQMFPNKPMIPWTRYNQVTAGRPSVNPNGDSVAFAGTLGKFNQVQNQIWITTSSDTAYQLEPNVPIGQNQGRSPNWSPDGKWIVFESTRPNPNPTQSTPLGVWVISSKGGAATQLVDTIYNAGHPEWSRDQTKIIFNSNKGIGMIDVPSQFLK